MQETKIRAFVQSVLEYINPLDGKIEKRGFLVNCSYGDMEAKQQEVENLDKMKWFDTFGIPDAELASKEKKELVRKLQESSLKAPVIRKVVVSNSGLYFSEREPFYVVGSKIFFSEKQLLENKMQVVIADNLGNSHTWRETFEEWQKNNFPQQNPIVIRTSEMAEKYINVAPKCSEIIFFATLYAGIKPILNAAGLGPYLNFIINVYGKSGSFKTSLVKAICSVCDSYELQGSYTTDKKSEILRKQREATGFTFILDDYHLQASDYGRKRQTDILNAVVRQVESDPSSGTVVTSSEFLDGIFSTQDRCIQIEMQPVDINLLSKIQCNHQDMPTIVDDFIQVLIKNYRNIIKEIPEIFKKIENLSDGTRLNNYTKALLLVSELYCKYLCKDELGRSQEKRLREALEFQNETQNKHMRLLRLLECDGGDIGIVLKMLNGGVFENRPEKDYHYLPNEVMVIGTQHVYLTPQALKYGLKQYLNGANVKSSEVIKHMAEEDILCCDKSGDSTKKIGLAKRRALCISYQTLINYCILNLSHDEEIQQIVRGKSLKY